MRPHVRECKQKIPFNKKFVLNTKKSNLDLIDIHNHVGVDLLFYLNGHYPYAQSWPVLAKEAEANGIGRLGVFPMVSHLALGIEGMRRGLVDPVGALEAIPYEFENRRLVSELAMSRRPYRRTLRLFWALRVSLQSGRCLHDRADACR